MLKASGRPAQNGRALCSNRAVYTTGTDISKPGFSKKYALLGFVLGVMLYAFIYLMRVISKGNINNAGDAEHYSQSRLLGDVYSKEEHKGIRALLHSALVAGFRYKGKLDEEKQIRKIASALDVACSHAGSDSVSLVSFSELTETGKRVLKALKDKGIKVVLTDVSKEEDDHYLLDLKNVVFMADNDCKVADLLTLGDKLNEYEISRIGSIYCGSF